ncbi:MAG TPA: AraC family transcriptional regulator [Puia sp.]
MKAELIVDADIVGKKRIFVKKFAKPYFNHPLHFHQFCELVWVEKGHGKIIIGDYVGDFSEGDLIMEGAGLPHLWRSDEVFYKKKKGVITAVTCIYFPAELIENISDDDAVLSAGRNLLNKAQRGLRFFGATREAVIQLIRQTAESKGLEQLANFLKIIDLLNKTKEVQPLAGVIYKNSNNPYDMDRFNEVYQFLLNNFHQDIMLEEIARICKLTPAAFCRYFKMRTQKNFSRFLNEIRIGHACKLLQDERMSIKNICYECGYNNPVNFFKFFKLIAKMTPGEYRKNIQMQQA